MANVWTHKFAVLGTDRISARSEEVAWQPAGNVLEWGSFEGGMTDLYLGTLENNSTEFKVALDGESSKEDFDRMVTGLPVAMGLYSDSEPGSTVGMQSKLLKMWDWTVKHGELWKGATTLLGRGLPMFGLALSTPEQAGAGPITENGHRGAVQLDPIPAGHEVVIWLHPTRIAGTNPEFEIRVISDTDQSFPLPVSRAVAATIESPLGFQELVVPGAITDNFWAVEVTSISGADSPALDLFASLAIRRAQ